MLIFRCAHMPLRWLRKERKLWVQQPQPSLAVSRTQSADKRPATLFVVTAYKAIELYFTNKIALHSVVSHAVTISSWQCWHVLHCDVPVAIVC